MRFQLAGTMSSCWAALRYVLPRRGLSAEERLDLGNEGCLVLEQESVAGVRIDRELGSGTRPVRVWLLASGSSRSAVPSAMSAGAAIVAVCLPAGSLRAHHWSTDRHLSAEPG